MPDFISNSCYGEDAMLFGLMDRLKSMSHVDLFAKSTYIDIGCFHPVIDNNTAFLYNLGWRGTLVDPNPVIKDEIAKYRFLDQYLEVAVDISTGIKDLYIFADTSSINTLDKNFSEKLSKGGRLDIQKTISVECITIEDVFDKHISKFNYPPTVLNIDIEGMDYDVISSYSFKYRPLFILIEDDILGSFNGSKIKTFMENKEYCIVSSNFLTGIYMDMTSPLFKDLKKIGFYDNG
jgi:FkbM family methyltransferase